MPVREVTHDADVEQLVELLRFMDRRRPVVVISRFRSSHRASIDVTAVEQRVSDLVDVYVIADGPRTRRFQELMPARTHVFGAAGRLYPADAAWQADPYAAPLFMVRSEADAKSKTRALITAALRVSSPAQITQGQRVSATVRSLDVPHRAVVETEDGQLATVARELLFPTVPIDRLLTVGMALEGLLRTDRYDVSDMIVPLNERVAGYTTGDLILVEVQRAEDLCAVVRVCPGVEVRVSRADVTSNDLDRVGDLMSRGEVLRARVVSASPAWRLTMLDVDDDEMPVASPALLRGGPPWLTPVAVEDLRSHAAAAGFDTGVAEEEPELEALEPSTAEVTAQLAADQLVEEVVDTVNIGAGAAAATLADRQDRFDPLVSEPGLQELLARELAARLAAVEGARVLTESLADLRRENQHLARSLNRVQKQLESSRDEAARIRVELRRARQASQRATATTTDHSRWFPDPQEQLRFEIRLMWAKKIPAADKQWHGLDENAYTLGPAFLASLDNFPQDREKVVEVIVEVLTGIADTSPGREVHQLRTGSGAGDPLVVRDSDGATCWRANIQQKSPQARRLHYWRTARCIELSRVVPHDVNTP
jgi:hypothetical protein